jgi:co-chaperonin GroES (HSP10)
MARSNAIGKMRQIAEKASTVKEASKAILEALGKHDTQVLHSRVLVAGYVRPAKTKGGLFLPDKTIEEDRFQGSIGLVIALGPGAFKDDNIAKFHGMKLKVGDWVMYLPADGIATFVNEVPCRLFDDTRILMKVTNPELYF